MYFDYEKEPCIVIIGDIKESKKITGRKEIQHQLNRALEEINIKYKELILTKFIITLGDEFQGVLSEGKDLMDILFFIEKEMYPVRLRFGIGIGRLSTDINNEYSIGADGPGYYKARDAVDFLKQGEKQNQSYPADTKVILEADNNNMQIMIDTVFMLMTVLKNTWTDKQREAVWDMLMYNDNQSESARRQGISQATLQRHLSKGNFYAFKEATGVLNKVFAQIGGVE